MVRVIKARATNPRWIEGMLRHGHRGVAEIAQGVDALFAFAATADVVPGSLFDATHAALIADETVLRAMRHANPEGAVAIVRRLDEARTRGLWVTRRNSTELEIERALARRVPLKSGGYLVIATVRDMMPPSTKQRWQNSFASVMVLTRTVFAAPVN